MAEQSDQFRYGANPGASVPMPGEDVPVNPYSLLGAVNDASEIAHTGWIVFLSIVAYLCVAVAGITHRDLLLNTPVPLPVLGVDIDLTAFFLFAPIILVFIHFGLLVQHVLLARKVLEFHAALRPLEPTERRSHPLRLELYTYNFTQSLAGADRSPVFAAFLHAMIWLSVVALPVLVILFIQITFLPYHDVSTTWVHRILLVADIGVVIVLGVFLLRRESSFWRAFWRAVRNQPINFMLTAALFGIVILFSFFVATIPDERLDQFTRSLNSVSKSANAAIDLPPRLVFWPTARFFEGEYDPATGRFKSIFQRNLVVANQDLVANKDEIEGEATVNLRDRDLRYAILDRSDLHRADMTGAKLDRASLVGTDLRGARLGCTDFDLIDDAKSIDALCVRAIGANFKDAKLADADLSHAVMPGAKFEKADLAGADMRAADLTGADFTGADLRRARLTFLAKLIDANFLLAKMQGADLNGARLHRAAFSSANLTGANLSRVLAYGATFDNANLDAVNLLAARLVGTNLTKASLRGADLNQATLWDTKATASDKLDLADLSALKLQAPDAKDIAAFEKLVAETTLAEVRSKLAPVLARAREQMRSRDWLSSRDAANWRTMQADHSPVLDAVDYRRRLTVLLNGLSCQNLAADGAAAIGIARRGKEASFRGDPLTLFRRLTDPTCPAAALLYRHDSEVMNELAAKAELLAAIAPPPSEPAVETTTEPAADATQP